MGQPQTLDTVGNVPSGADRAPRPRPARGPFLGSQRGDKITVHGSFHFAIIWVLDPFSNLNYYKCSESPSVPTQMFSDRYQTLTLAFTYSILLHFTSRSASGAGPPTTCLSQLGRSRSAACDSGGAAVHLRI